MFGIGRCHLHWTVISPSSPHLLPNGLFSPQNRISFELLALSGLSGFSTFKGGKMLIFQGFANSRIVREFPPFSFKVRIATLTRNQFASNRTWVRIPSSPPKKSSKLKGLLDFPFSRILIFPNSCVRTAYFLVENRVQIRFCYLALYSAFHNTTRMPCNRFSTSISPSRRTLVRRDGEIFQRTS